MDETRQELTSFVGRDVYSSNGTYIGEVDDVKLDVGRETVTGLAIGNVNGDLFSAANRGARGVIVPYRWVRAVDDVILVSEIVERTQEESEGETDEEGEVEDEKEAAAA
ncbi:PRC-barrel domain-containing protein [Saliphagus infecundisoli]|uniref:PRC-barrel domain-containing protein n=1 Tax=Saliphagus infecundisoli TaxID=1849069 RepID=A0ABD5QI69_9EURY|nr:PRC-barrel domain-containing protein [Saliphagus infecundisoli]